jgi:hypothetical protein
MLACVGGGTVEQGPLAARLSGRRGGSWERWGRHRKKRKIENRRWQKGHSADSATFAKGSRRARECASADSPRRPFRRRNSGAARKRCWSQLGRTVRGALVQLAAVLAGKALRRAWEYASSGQLRTVRRLPWANVRGIWGWRL